MLAAALLSAVLSTRGGADGAVADSSRGDSVQTGQIREKVGVLGPTRSARIHAPTCHQPVPDCTSSSLMKPFSTTHFGLKAPCKKLHPVPQHCASVLGGVVDVDEVPGQIITTTPVMRPPVPTPYNAILYHKPLTNSTNPTSRSSVSLLSLVYGCHHSATNI